MKLIETKTLASAQSEITFSSIPQNFQDIFIKMSVRGNNANFQGLQIYFNGSNSNLASTYLLGDGSSPGASTLSYGFAASIGGTGSTLNTFSNGDLYIPNYSGSANKSFLSDSVTENNTTNSFQNINVGVWSQTAPITSFTLFGQGGTNDLIAGTTISLYGIGGLGDGGPKATGGTIARSGNYWVHTFTASGTFTTLANISDVEYLVVAGGAGGGNGNGGGGGGAGGYRSSVTGESSGGGASAETKLSLASGTAYTVTVGAGGAVSSNGVNSVFSTITSIGGGTGAAGASGLSGATGGSGGGSGRDSGSATLPGGAGTANQGFAGGNSNPSNGGGGGGGAGAVGVDGLNDNTNNGGGNGGNGLASTITGSSVTRGGGGGGAGYAVTNAFGLGGSGGGGRGSGGSPYSAPGAVAGSPNTGGGGGGGGNSPFTSVGQPGGSGIVIVRYLV